jgi:hypothetical protein
MAAISKTDVAIRAVVRAWWKSAGEVAQRAESRATAERLADRIGPPVDRFVNSMGLQFFVDVARGLGHRRVTIGRVLAAAQRWGDVGLDCGDGLIATLERLAICDPPRICVTGPMVTP